MMKTPRPNRSLLQREINRRDKKRRNWCRRCPFSAPSGQCLDTTIRSGRCGDWVFYLLPDGKQCRRRWVRPKDPLTPAQVRNRARLGTASRKYSNLLTDQEHDAFIAASTGQTVDWAVEAGRAANSGISGIPVASPWALLQGSGLR